MATITARYNDDESFTALLTRIGISPRERNRLSNDGFTTMKLMVDHYSHDIDDLCKYLKELNKSFGSANVNMRINFNPFMISRLLDT